MTDSNPSDFDDIVGVVYNDEDDSSIFKQTQPVDAIPAEVLEDLVAEWRERAEAKDSDVVGNVQYQMLHERANDLSKVINDYGDSDE